MTMSSHDWSEHAFFDMPDRDSLTAAPPRLARCGIASALGGGTRSYNVLISLDVPGQVADHFIERYSTPGDLVLDPFSGRGTVPLQARVEGRRSVSNDLNPLAYVLSQAKANPPTWSGADTFLRRLENSYRRADHAELDAPEDIRMLYHPNTLRQICYLRDYLLCRDLADWSQEEFMIGGALAGIMHGSYRLRYFSVPKY